MRGSPGSTGILLRWNSNTPSSGQKKFRDAGGSVPKFRPSWRTKMLGWMAERFGIDMVLPTIATMEDVDSRDYKKDTNEVKMAKQERSHAQVLRQLGRSNRGGLEGSALAQIEGRHRTAGGNALRAAVLGAEDGLVSNLSLVMGVAGAALSSSGILLTGLAGMLAGAISMALGEWVSVQSSRELYEKQIATEKEEIATMPEEEIEELSLIYQARGLEEAEARRIAKQIMSNKETALDTLVRDELGLDPKELGGSAWEAAITSFPAVRSWGGLPCRSLYLHGRHARHYRQRALQLVRPFHHRRGHHAVHRPPGPLFRSPPGGIRPGRGGSDVHGGQAAWRDGCWIAKDRELGSWNSGLEE